jgi:hypothetical protein
MYVLEQSKVMQKGTIKKSVDKLQRSFKNMNTEVSRNGGKGTSKM